MRGNTRAEPPSSSTGKNRTSSSAVSSNPDATIKHTEKSAIRMQNQAARSTCRHHSQKVSTCRSDINSVRSLPAAAALARTEQMQFGSQQQSRCNNQIHRAERDTNADSEEYVQTSRRSQKVSACRSDINRQLC